MLLLIAKYFCYYFVLDDGYRPYYYNLWHTSDLDDTGVNHGREQPSSPPTHSPSAAGPSQAESGNDCDANSRI